MYLDNLIEKHGKAFKIWLVIILIIISFIYLRFFLQKGIIYDNKFLVKNESEQEINFQGKSKWGPIKLVVKGDYRKGENVALDYQLPNNINKKYLVKFKLEEPNYKYKIEILDDKKIMKFKGFHLENNDLTNLLDESEEIVFPDFEFYSIQDEPKSPYDSNYKITNYNIMNLATQKNLDIRGDYRFLFMGLLLLFITYVDIKHPLFFFQLDTWLNVEDAKPSEFFLKMQKISWYVIPMISLILFVFAIS